MKKQDVVHRRIRATAVNYLLISFALHGRSCFATIQPSGCVVVAFFTVDDAGQVHWTDDAGTQPCVHARGASIWRGFSRNASYFTFAKQLRDFIMTGKRISQLTLDCWWAVHGYERGTSFVQSDAHFLGIVEEENRGSNPDLQSNADC